MENVKILIVEDEVIIAMELQSILQALGYQVTSIVDTGEKAIQKAESDSPDIILMDIRIKGKMDGIKAAEVIRSEFGIPIIFSTAYLDRERIERAKITMPFGYVLKPIQERDLKVTIEMALYVSQVDAERRKAEEILRFEKARTQQYLDVAGVLLIALDVHGNVTSINPKGCEILGCKHDEIIGHSWFDNFLSSEDIDEVKKVFSQIIHGDIKPVEYYENPINRKDGSQRFVAWHNSILRNSSGEILGLFSSGEDITERKQAEKKLKKSYAMVNASPDAIITTDIDENITFWNKGAERIYGYLAEEVEGKSIRIIYKDKDLHILESMIADLMQGGDIPSIEVTCIDKHQNDVQILLSLSVIRDNSGNISELVGFTKDISDRKVAEGQPAAG